MTAKTISIINLKGGVGKSTLAMILGEFLVFKYSKRVLLIDMDAQGNLSYCMIPESAIQTQERNQRTIYHLLKMALQGQKANISQFITQPPFVVSNIARSSASNYPGRIDMVVSVPTFAELDEDLLDLWERGSRMPTELRTSLREALEPVLEEYDYILIDCPPGLSIFSSTALIASDYYVSPVIPEPLSLQGVDLIQHRATGIVDRYKHRIQFKGVILNIVKYYRSTHQRISDMLFDSGNDRYSPFQYWVPDSERLRKLGEFDPDLQGTWAGGLNAKFSSLNEKYSLSYRLTNPTSGPLNCTSVEGAKYRLEDRLANLVEEFQERCR